MLSKIMKTANFLQEKMIKTFARALQSAARGSRHLLRADRTTETGLYTHV